METLATNTELDDNFDEVTPVQSDGTQEASTTVDDNADEDTEDRESDEANSSKPEKVDERELQVQKILARYGNDPVKLAQAAAFMQRTMSRQGNELGQLRKLAQQPEEVQYSQTQSDGTNEDDAEFSDLLNGTLPEPKPVVPNDAPPEEVEAFKWNEDSLFDPATDVIDEETGFPVDEEGNVFTPKNRLGIYYIPDTAIDAYRRKLTEQYPNDPVKVLTLVADKQRENAQYQQEQLFGDGRENKGIEGQAVRAHLVPAHKEEQRIATILSRFMPKEEAVASARYLKQQCMTILPQAFRQQKVSVDEYFHPEALAQTMRTVYAGLDPEELRKEATKGMAKPTQEQGARVRNGQQPSGRSAAVPSTTVDPKPAKRTQQAAQPQGRYVPQTHEFDDD